MNLNTLVVQNTQKQAKPVVYDKDFNVVFNLQYLSKPEFQQLIAKHTKIDFNKKTHKPEESIDADALNLEVATTCIKGWKGLNYEYVARMSEIDISSVQNPKEDIPFTSENISFLMKQAYGFDGWLIDTIRDAAQFSKVKEAEVKN